MINIDSYLEDPSLYPPEEINCYLYGQCDIFAFALNQVFNLPILAYLEKRKVDLKKKVVVLPGLIHAMCVVSKEDNLIFDAKGIRTIDTMKKEYLFHSDAWFEEMTPERVISDFSINDPKKGDYIAKATALILKHYSPLLERFQHEAKR